MASVNAVNELAASCAAAPPRAPERITGVEPA
jgi:hypothetical protein